MECGSASYRLWLEFHSGSSTAAVIDKFKDGLKSFTTSKGTIQFPLDKRLPIALIKRLVKERVRQIESKQRP